MSNTTDTKILSPENVPMFVAVAFIIAAIALAISLVSYTRIKEAAVGLSVLQLAKAKADTKIQARQDARVDKLEKKLLALEEQAAEARKATAMRPSPAEAAAAQ